ncbi:hypothetical protein [Streptomyces sp. NPDC019224]|uniref:hypothetical protein n=1 Tax=Streptomyces sp. NPDC019224 TaxID=3154484 RepID=UPI00340E3CAD
MKEPAREHRHTPERPDDSPGAGEGGEVRVHANCTFVYPLVRADGAGAVSRTIVRRDLTMSLRDPARWQATRGKLDLTEYAGEYSNSACGVYDGYFHPVFPDGGAAAAPATGPAVDPYGRGRAAGGAEDHEVCGTSTRT